MNNCPNCQRSIQVEDVFCPGCGQGVQSHMDSVGDFVKHFLGDYFAYDSKLVVSLRPLLFSPGSITVDYTQGKRARYIPPMRMYIFISFLFFVCLSVFTHSSPEDIDSPIKQDAFFGTWLPRIFFLGLPFFAVFQNFIFRKKGLGYIPAFVFSLHFHAFAFLSLTVYLLLSRLLSELGAAVVNSWIFVAWVVWISFYLHIALRRLYGRSFAANLLRLIALALIYGFLITVLSMAAILFLE